MNAWNPIIFAAQFAEFRIDQDSVELEGNKITFSLTQELDADISVTGEIAGKPKSTTFWFMPAGCVSPEDEQESEYPSLAITDVTIARAIDSDGVEVMNGMPFLLTSAQVEQLNERVNELCEIRFERAVDNLSPDFCMEFLGEII